MRSRPRTAAGRIAVARFGQPLSLAKADHGWGPGPYQDASSTDVVVHRGTALTSFTSRGDLYRLDPTGDTLGKGHLNDAFPFDWGVSGRTPRSTSVPREMLFFNYSKNAPYLHYMGGRRPQRPGSLR